MGKLTTMVKLETGSVAVNCDRCLSLRKNVPVTLVFSLE